MMFGFFTRRRQLARAVKPVRRPRLCLEHLETRDCPAAPVITDFAVAPLHGHLVSVSGTVTEDSPGGVYLKFSGAISGTTFACKGGNFHLTAQGDVPGLISAMALGSENLWSNAVSAMLTVSKPSLTLSVLPGVGHSVTLMGSVSDIDAPSLTVSFAGAVSDSVGVGPNGTYSLTTSNAVLGQVLATTTNLWGLAAAPATGLVANKPPVITGFSVVKLSAQLYELQGAVSDESPAGLQVSFSGTPSTNGTGAWVGDDGTFSTTVMVAAGETGIVTANVTDWWGAAATPVQSLMV